MIKTKYLAAASACIAATAFGPAAAQIGERETAEYPSFTPSEALRNGYTAEDLRDAAVQGKNGKTVGSVEDVVISANGQIQHLVVAVNEGLFGTGGQRLAVDWEAVEVGPRDEYGIDYIAVSATEGNLEEAEAFTDKPDAVKGGPNEWRASELIGDNVDLKGREDAGYVSDIMFDKNGEVQAIATAAQIESTIVSFYSPYSGEDEGWDAGDDYYVVPYTEAELRKLMPEDATRQARN